MTHIIIDRTRTDRDVPLTTTASALALNAGNLYVYKLGQGPIISSLDARSSGGVWTNSQNHNSIGLQIRINGSNFGSTRGTSTVTFGEPVNIQGWAPVTKEAASYVSWSSTQITVTVPSMSPGKSGETGTYHNVRVYVGGVESNAASFYIDPVTINPALGTATRTAKSSYTDLLSGQLGGATGYDYTSSNYEGIIISAQENVLFENCTFYNSNGSIPGANCGVVTLRDYEGVCRNITFLNCTVKNNWGDGIGGTDNGGVNGVKVVCIDANDKTIVHDITFVGCSFGTIGSTGGAFSRMGYEQVNGENTTPLHCSTNIGFHDCSFEPTGGEMFSDNPGDLYHLMENCTFKGRVWTPLNIYSYGWETNQGRYIEVRDCHFWSCLSGCINISNPPGSVYTILFTGCDFDATHAYGTGIGTNSSFFFAFTNAAYIHLADCDFYTGTASTCLMYAGYSSSTDPDWRTSHHIDFSGSHIHGYINKTGTPVIQSTARAYWKEDVPIIQASTIVWPETP